MQVSFESTRIRMGAATTNLCHAQRDRLHRHPRMRSTHKLPDTSVGRRCTSGAASKFRESVWTRARVSRPSPQLPAPPDVYLCESPRRTAGGPHRKSPSQPGPTDSDGTPLQHGPRRAAARPTRFPSPSPCARMHTERGPRTRNLQRADRLGYRSTARSDGTWYVPRPRLPASRALLLNMTGLCLADAAWTREAAPIRDDLGCQLCGRSSTPPCICLLPVYVSSVLVVVLHRVLTESA